MPRVICSRKICVENRESRAASRRNEIFVSLFKIRNLAGQIYFRDTFADGNIFDERPRNFICRSERAGAAERQRAKTVAGERPRNSFDRAGCSLRAERDICCWRRAKRAVIVLIPRVFEKFPAGNIHRAAVTRRLNAVAGVRPVERNICRAESIQ